VQAIVSIVALDKDALEKEIDDIPSRRVMLLESPNIESIFDEDLPMFVPHFLFTLLKNVVTTRRPVCRYQHSIRHGIVPTQVRKCK
jgi:hypothetical protein